MLDRCLLLYISYYWLPWENNAFKFNSKNFIAFKLKCFASPWSDVIWQVDMQIMNNTMNMFWLYYEEFCLQLNFFISEEHRIKKSTLLMYLLRIINSKMKGESTVCSCCFLFGFLLLRYNLPDWPFKNHL